MSSVIKVLTVTQLNRSIRSLLEYEVGEVSVEGEISNLTQPSSGHLYFTLKDAVAQLRCVFFRNRNFKMKAPLENGQKVILRGKLSLYEARGDFQLIVDSAEPAGLGDLHRQFELLKDKLFKQGLFSQELKKSIPRFASCIGVITSPTGAAIRDILTTLKRRYPLSDVLIYPCEVQGKGASNQLAQAVDYANRYPQCEVLILARGGGSLEDLWAFNEENLALTLSKSKIPVVTGIGHETDFTIADFVSDFRAATPTAAAEIVTPDKEELLEIVYKFQRLQHQSMARFLLHLRTHLNHQIEKITSPGHLIRVYWQSLDYANSQLQRSLRLTLINQRHRLHQLIAKLKIQNPVLLLKHAQTKRLVLQEKLDIYLKRSLDVKRQKLIALSTALSALSPLATLDRGYAIATYRKKVLTDGSSVKLGQIVDVRLAKGSLKSKVVGYEEDSKSKI